MTSKIFCVFSIFEIRIDSHTFLVCKIAIQHAISMDWEHSSMIATSKGDPLQLLLATSADVFLAVRCLRAPSPEVADARVERTTLASEYKSGIKNVRAKSPRFTSIYCVIFGGFLDPRKHSSKHGNFDRLILRGF